MVEGVEEGVEILEERRSDVFNTGVAIIVRMLLILAVVVSWLIPVLDILLFFLCFVRHVLCIPLQDRCKNTRLKRDIVEFTSAKDQKEFRKLKIEKNR